MESTSLPSDRFLVNPVGTIATWTTKGEPGVYEMAIEQIMLNKIITRSKKADNSQIVKIREPWAFLTSSATLFQEDSLSWTHEVLSGNLHDLLDLRVGKQCLGKIRECRSTGLVFDWRYEVKVLDRRRSLGPFIESDEFVIEEVRRAGAYCSTMILHYASEIPSFTQYFYRDNEGRNDESHLSKIVFPK